MRQTGLGDPQEGRNPSENVLAKQELTPHAAAVTLCVGAGVFCNNCHRAGQTVSGCSLGQGTAFVFLLTLCHITKGMCSCSTVPQREKRQA